MAIHVRALRTTIVAMGLGLAAPAFIPAGAAIAAQSERFDQGRDIVSRTQSDLQRAASFHRNSKKEQERYKNAQHHLSELDRHFTKGKFDKDTMDSAIEDIQNILDHNTLQSQDRDVLMQDVNQLRAIRSNHG
jgi:parvulin-like peptidyl-prolyl isomerase